MARKQKHEDHTNHEAWAIPYGDLVTLLLAFFVVMYAISSVNEGKYRVLADSLSEAFGGPPRVIEPLQLGEVQPRSMQRREGTPQTRGGAAAAHGMQRIPGLEGAAGGMPESIDLHVDRAALVRAEDQFQEISKAVEAALAGLISEDLVNIRRGDLWMEIEIKSDILFTSGSAVPQQTAVPTLEKLAQALAPFPNPLRIEGHTDNVPITTAAFPSNWELSSARAATVVHLFQDNGIAPGRLAVIGYGEFRPRADNRLAAGRDTNRRVVIVILATEGGHPDEATAFAGDAVPPPPRPALPVPAAPQPREPLP